MCFSLYKNSYAENYIPQLISFSHKYITPHSQAPVGNAIKLFTTSITSITVYLAESGRKIFTPHSQAPLGNALLFTSLKAGGRFFFGSFLKCQKKE